MLNIGIENEDHGKQGKSNMFDFMSFVTFLVLSFLGPGQKREM